MAGIGSYEHANTYLEHVFVPDFNWRFTVPPAQPGRAFLPLVGVDLELLLSAQHPRAVQNDSTVSFKNRVLQAAAHPPRAHYVPRVELVASFLAHPRAPRRGAGGQSHSWTDTFMSHRPRHLIRVRAK